MECIVTKREKLSERISLDGTFPLIETLAYERCSSAEKVWYECPYCGYETSTIWLYPAVPMIFHCDVCGNLLIFPPTNVFEDVDQEGKNG